MPVLAPEDPTSPFEEFLDNNKKLLIFGLIAVVLIIVGIILFNHFKESAAHAAAESFTSTETVGDLDKVISEYGGTVPGGNALVRKAAVLWDQGDEGGSVKVLEEFVKDYGDHPLLATAIYGLGSKAVSMNKPEQAKKHFNRVLSEFGSSGVAAFASIDLGDIERAAGNLEEARKNYERVASGGKFAEHAARDLAKEKLRVLEVVLPPEEERPKPKPPEKKPGEGDDKKPGEGDNKKPGEGDNKKPGEGDNKKPGEGDNKKPGEGDNKKPGEGDHKKPGEGDNKKPGEGDNKKPGEGDHKKPGEGDNKKPGEGDNKKPGEGDNKKPGEGDHKKPGEGEEKNGEAGTVVPGIGNEP